jgi:cobalt/nickel transport protein
MFDYREPLDVVAETLHLSDLTESFNWTPFLGYSVPGLNAWAGYVIAGLLGVGVILSLGYILKRLLSQS